MAAIPGFSILSPPQDTNILGFPSLSPDDPSDQANTPGADPASSLRQAALLTLRSRRKPHTGSDLSAGLPSRPTRVTASSIVLDYGQDEPSSAPPSSVAPPAVPATPALPAPVSAHVPLPAPSHTPVRKVASPTHAVQEDTTMREEGEISDNEGPPSPPQPPPRRSPPKEMTSVPKPSRNMPSSGLVSSSPHSTFLHPTSISQPPIAKTDQTFSQPPASRTPPRPSLVERLAPVSPISIKSDTFQLESPPYLVDANHVRPGLNMTLEQYTTAKDIVLDLLGWGVAPEYLVDCGFSREIVYYVFSELNLRLPSNFDATGILPYPPTPEMVASWLGVSYDSSEQSSEKPASLRSRGSVSHPLPQKPPIVSPQGSVVMPTFKPQLTVTTSSASASDSPSGTTLADMEQQRRQELLARKAVQASRKRKESNVSGTSSSMASANDPSPMDVEEQLLTQPLAPASSVEDFLKSIEPVFIGSASSKNFGTESSSFIRASPDAMDVDDAIPGLGGGSYLEHYPKSSPSIEVAAQSPEKSRRPRSVSRSSMDFSDVASSSDESKAKGSVLKRKASVSLKKTNSTYSGDSSNGTPVPSESQPVAPFRRGTKRPVAADFVDLDLANASRHNSNGYGHNGAQHPNPHVRRKMNAAAMGGFASVSSMRRCVIDLSDSEDDEEAEEGEELEEHHVASFTIRPASAAGSTAGAAASGDPTKLELEIKRIREEIKAREDSRQKRLAKNLGSSTPSAIATPLATPVSPSLLPVKALDLLMVKQEPTELPGLTAAASANATATLFPASVVSGQKLASTELKGERDMSSSPNASPPSAQLAGQALISHPSQSNGDSVMSTPTGDSPRSATNGIPHGTTGEQVLTAEARQEQVVSPGASTSSSMSSPRALSPFSQENGFGHRSVDVATSTQDPQALTSADATHTPAPPRYKAYEPILSSYPLLSGHSLASQQSPQASSPRSWLRVPDLKPLKLRTALRSIAAAGSQGQRVCQYEVPGGGECRDVKCGDLHVGRIAVEPSDEDTASYLQETLPGNVRAADPLELTHALRHARAQMGTSTFDERVGAVWASLVEARER